MPDHETPRFGPFSVGPVLGVGGMGVVHVASDVRSGRRVALKLMSGPVAEDEVFRERFRREAEVLTRVDSPHVIQVYDHGEQDGTLWIATQLVAGGDLGRLLRERGPMPASLAAEACRQVADALVSTHAVGVVHRDVKPGNVLVRSPDDHRLEVCLCDFGIATTGPTGLTASGAIAGTFDYLAPEYGLGALPGPAGDVYAVGCLLWACLTGRPPYTGSDVDVARGHRSGELPRLVGSGPQVALLNRVLAGCLAKEPGGRYPSAAALREDLRSAARLPSEPVRPVARSGPGGSEVAAPTRTAGALAPRRSRRRMVVVAGLVLAAIVAGSVTALAGRDEEPDGQPGSASGGAPGGGAVDGPDGRDGGVRGDLTGDGLGDLVVRDWDEPMRTVVLDGDGESFGEPQVLLDGEAFTVVTGDVDGDGVEEVVAAAEDFEAEGQRVVTVTVTDADGGEESYDVPAAGVSSELASPVLADLDGDGRDDLVMTNFFGSSGDRLDIVAARSTGDGFEELTPRFGARREFERVMPGDVDGDGDDDLVVTLPDSLEVLVAGDDPAGELESDGPVTLSDFLLNPVLGDFDGDGRGEIASVGVGGASAERASLLRWDGTGWDAELWLEDSGGVDLGQPNPATGVIDGDGDGIDDLVRFEDTGAAADTVWVLRGSADGFAAPVAWTTYRCSCRTSYDPGLSFVP